MNSVKIGTAYGDTADVPPSAAEPLRVLPIIDITPLRTGDPSATADVVEQIAAAAQEIGFFYIVGHGVPGDVVEFMRREAQLFFDSPLEDKMKVHTAYSPNYRGYVPSNSKAYGPDKKVTLESFSLGLELDPSDKDYAGHPLHGPNPWPEGRPGFREAGLAYWNAMTELSRHLLRGFAQALDLPEDDLYQQFRKPTSQIRLISYPAGIPGAEQLGTGAHCDSGAFTILWQDGTGGLEVHTRSGEWAAVVPVEGAFIVNIGDTLEVWTGGLFKSTPHRVINRSPRRRQSIAYFANCDFDAQLMAFPKFASDGAASGGRYGDAILGFFQRFLGAAKADLA